MPSGHINPPAGFNPPAAFGPVCITGEPSGAAFGGGSAELGLSERHYRGQKHDVLPCCGERARRLKAPQTGVDSLRNASPARPPLRPAGSARPALSAISSSCLVFCAQVAAKSAS